MLCIKTSVSSPYMAIFLRSINSRTENMRGSGSSKDLLDAAEETIEELLHEGYLQDGSAFQPPPWRSASTPQPFAGGHPGPSDHLPRSPPSSSLLSPAAQPFVPSGRSKAQRWRDASPSAASDVSPSAHASYRDVLLASPPAPEQGLRKASTPSLASVIGLCSFRSPRPEVGEFRWSLAIPDAVASPSPAHRPLLKPMLTCEGGVLTALLGRISPLCAAVPLVTSVAWSPGTARSCARVGPERRNSWDAPPIAE
jgi:hypothetical protein